MQFCFHPMAASAKAILRTQKGSKHIELCERSITFDVIEAENFYFKKGNEVMRKTILYIILNINKKMLGGMEVVETLASVLKPYLRLK